MALNYTHCNTDDLKELFGRDLDAEELQNLSEIIEDQAWFIRQDKPMLSHAQSLEDAVPDALITMQNRIAIHRRNAAQKMSVIVDRLRYVEDEWVKNPGEGMKAITVSSPFMKAGAKESVSGFQNAAVAKILGGFNTELSRLDPTGRLRKVYQSGDLNDDLFRAAGAIDDVDGAGVTLSKLPKDAVTLAKLIRKYSELARLEFNRAGGNIERLAGRLVRRSHKTQKIRKARASLKSGGYASNALTDEDAWVGYMMAELDMNRSFRGALELDEVETTLQRKYDDFIRHDHLRSDNFGSPSRVGTSLGREQVFHFKNGVEGEIQYHKLFGENSIADSVFSEFRLLGNKTGLMQKLGPDPLGALQTVALSTQKMARKAGKKAEKRFNTITGDGEFMKTNGGGTDPMSRWWKEISGQNSGTVENIYTTLGAIARFRANITFLGKATLASITDVATVGAGLRYQGRGFFDSYREAIGAIFEPKASDAFKRDIYEALFIGIDSMNGLNSGKFLDADEPLGAMSKMSALFFKMTGLTQWTENMQRGAAIANARYMGLQTTKSWGGLDKSLRNLLETYGFTKADWEKISKADFSKSPDGKRYLSIDTLNSISDDLFENPEARRILEQKLRNYHLDMVDSMVIMPGVETRALVTGGHAAGSYQRELYRAFYQFKSFPISVYKNAVRREVFGRGTEEIGFFKALADGNGEWQGMTELMLASTVTGYLSLTLKDLASGKTPRIPENQEMATKLFLDSMLQGGAAGIYGDIILGDAMRRQPLDRGLLETLGGPTFGFISKDLVGTGSEIGFITYGMISGEGEAGGEEIQARIWGAVDRNLPLANTFWLKSALDYSFLNQVREDMAPGSMERLNKRAEERGQEYLYPLP